MIYIVATAINTQQKTSAMTLIISRSIFQSESGATESGSISSYEKDSEIEMQITQDPQAITVPITVCISIMIG